MLPVQRQSKGRSGRRRSHDAMKAVSVTIDPLSGNPKAHHRVAKVSGYVRPGLKITVKKLKIGL